MNKISNFHIDRLIKCLDISPLCLELIIGLMFSYIDIVKISDKHYSIRFSECLNDDLIVVIDYIKKNVMNIDNPDFVYLHLLKYRKSMVITRRYLNSISRNGIIVFLLSFVVFNIKDKGWVFSSDKFNKDDYMIIRKYLYITYSVNSEYIDNTLRLNFNDIYTIMMPDYLELIKKLSK